MINSKELKNRLDDIISQPVSKETNVFLRNMINYNDVTKFNNFSYLITEIDNSEDGLMCKNILNNILKYLQNPSADIILAGYLKCDGAKISDVILTDTTNLVNKAFSDNIKIVKDKEPLAIADSLLSDYIEYDMATKTIISHSKG